FAGLHIPSHTRLLTHTLAHTHTCAHTHMPSHTHACAHTHIPSHTHTHTTVGLIGTRMVLQLLPLTAHFHVHMVTHTYRPLTHKESHTHTLTHACTRTHTHTLTHACTHMLFYISFTHARIHTR